MICSAKGISCTELKKNKCKVEYTKCKIIISYHTCLTKYGTWTIHNNSCYVDYCGAVQTLPKHYHQDIHLSINEFTHLHCLSINFMLTVAKIFFGNLQ